MTRKVGYGTLNEIGELDLDYMEHDYMSIKGHKRSHGTSRNLKVIVQSHMMLFEMVRIVKEIMSIRLVFFHKRSLMLIHKQSTNTQQNLRQ